MKFLVVSDSGDGAGLVWRLQEEGNIVQIFIREPASRPILANMVEHVSSVENGINNKPDVVIYDMSGAGKEADGLRKRGIKVVGAGDLCDMLELERSYAMDVAERLGIKVPPFSVFKSTQIKEAIKFIVDTGKRYVLKPHDNQGLDLTYVAKDPEDMINQLNWAVDQKLLKGDFVLQEFIEGAEISTEMWFSDGNPIPQLANSTIEVKKFLTGNLGPSTGCEFSTVWGYGDDTSKIVKQTIKKIYPLIKEYGYSGPIDVNAIVSEGEAHFLEFTPRLGYSAIYAFAELINGDLGEFFYNIAYRNVNDCELNKGVGVALTVSIPPYPLDSGKSFNKESVKKTAEQIVSDIPSNGFWPFDIKSNPHNLVTAGTLGLACYLSAKGDNVEEADEAVYSLADQISIPNAQYRLDGAERAMQDIPTLEGMGFDVPELCSPQEVTQEEDSIPLGELIPVEDE